MTIEQRLAEIIQAFCADALSRAVNLNVDLDVVLCVLAQALLAAFRLRLPRLRHRHPRHPPAPLPRHPRNHHQRRRHHHRHAQPPRLLTRPAPGRPPRRHHRPLVAKPPPPLPVRLAKGARFAAWKSALIRGTRQVTVYLRRRRACLRIASTFAANAAGSMIGVPRHGDIDSRSVSLETMSSAPTSAARSRIRLSSWSGQS